MAHISYLTSIPIIKRLIECFCSIKHTSHISYITSIPVSDILIKGMIIVE